VRVEKPGAWSLASDKVDVTLRLWGSGLLGRTRLALGGVTLIVPPGLTLESVPTLWDLMALPHGGFRAELREPARGLAATWLPGAAGGRVEASATDLPAGRLLAVRRDGSALLDAGIVSGTARLDRLPGSTRFDVGIRGRAVRVPAVSNESSIGEAPGYGPLEWRCSSRAPGALGGLSRPAGLAFDLDGAVLSIAGKSASDRHLVDLRWRSNEDFARLFRTSGLEQEAALRVGNTAGATSAPPPLGSLQYG
jgi:hypothetical protein